jgi:hypothetical protein
MNIGIDLYRSAKAEERQGLQFDVGYVVTRLFVLFPDMILSEEYYQNFINQTRNLGPGCEPALPIADRDANERGPRLGFEVPSHSIRGGISRYVISFTCPADASPRMVAMIKEFLNSFSFSIFCND